MVISMDTASICSVASRETVAPSPVSEPIPSKAAAAGWRKDEGCVTVALENSDSELSDLPD